MSYSDVYSMKGKDFQKSLSSVLSKAESHLIKFPNEFFSGEPNRHQIPVTIFIVASGCLDF